MSAFNGESAMPTLEESNKSLHHLFPERASCSASYAERKGGKFEPSLIANLNDVYQWNTVNGGVRKRV